MEKKTASFCVIRTYRGKKNTLVEKVSFELIIPRSDYFFNAPFTVWLRKLRNWNIFTLHENDKTEANKMEEKKYFDKIKP